MKCENCINSRVIVSENGKHSVCCLSNKKVKECLISNKHHKELKEEKK